LKVKKKNMTKKFSDQEKFECAIGSHKWYVQGMIRQCDICHNTEILDLQTHKWVSIGVSKLLLDEIVSSGYTPFSNIKFKPVQLASSSKPIDNTRDYLIRWSFACKTNQFNSGFFCSGGSTV
jgi:hypothetical protein